VKDHDREVLKAALSCYETYKETIEKSGVLNLIGDDVDVFCVHERSPVIG
jgi:hypothetical protein